MKEFVFQVDFGLSYFSLSLLLMHNSVIVWNERKYDISLDFIFSWIFRFISFYFMLSQEFESFNLFTNLSIVAQSHFKMFTNAFSENLVCSKFNDECVRWFCWTMKATNGRNFQLWTVPLTNTLRLTDDKSAIRANTSSFSYFSSSIFSYFSFFMSFVNITNVLLVNGFQCWKYENTKSFNECYTYRLLKYMLYMRMYRNVS